MSRPPDALRIGSLWSIRGGVIAWRVTSWNCWRVCLEHGMSSIRVSMDALNRDWCVSNQTGD